VKAGEGMKKKYPIKLIPRVYSSSGITEVINIDTGISELVAASESVTDGTPREVLADRKAIKQSEFYQGVASGFRPEITFVLWVADYLGEDRLTYNGDLYEVIRRYPDMDDIEIELVCQRVDDANQNLSPLRDGF